MSKPYELVQIVIDKDDQVLAFTVTTRRRDFNPTIEWAGTPIVLGKTRIAEVFPEPARMVVDRIAGYADMSSFGYLESSGSLHAANFQECAIGATSAGYFDGSNSLFIGHPVTRLLNDAADWEPKKGDRQIYPWLYKDAVWATKQETSELLDSKAIRDYRGQAAINTVVVTAPTVDVTMLQQIMPDLSAGLANQSE
jgi:hypothetical protein